MSQRRRTDRRRATVLLEFALTLPFMLFLLAFSIDMGRMVYAAHAAQQVATEAARQSAVFGAAGIDGNHASAVPASRESVRNTCNATPSQCQMALYAARTAIAGTPGGQMMQNWSLSVFENTEASYGRICSASATNVRIQIAYQLNWLTPGMTGLLGLVGNSGETAASQPLPAASIVSKATARCEVE